MKRNLAIVSALGLALAAPGIGLGFSPDSFAQQERPSGVPGSTGQPTGTTPPAAKSDTMTSMPGTGTAQVQGNKLIGADVKGADNEKIGDVTEVLVSTEGKINAVVVSVGGFLGMGDRRVALPWEQLRFSSEGSDLVVMASATEEALKEMPEYKDPPRSTGERARGSDPGMPGGAGAGAGGAARDSSRPMRPAPTE